MATFDLMILLARDARVPAALQRQSTVLHVDADLLTRDTWQFGGDDKSVRGLTQIDSRGPALWAGRNALETMLNGQQVA